MSPTANAGRVSFFNQSESSRKRVQEMVDFYFPLCAAWFGMPDDLKTRTDQLAYRIRGASNDEMRQKWLSRIVPYSENVGIKVPAHFDAEQGKFVLDYEAPIYLDEEKRQVGLRPADHLGRTTESLEERLKAQGTVDRTRYVGSLGQRALVARRPHS